MHAQPSLMRSMIFVSLCAELGDKLQSFQLSLSATNRGLRNRQSQKHETCNLLLNREWNWKQRTQEFYLIEKKKINLGLVLCLLEILMSVCPCFQTESFLAPVWFQHVNLFFWLWNSYIPIPLHHWPYCLLINSSDVRTKKKKGLDWKLCPLHNAPHLYVTCRDGKSNLWLTDACCHIGIVIPGWQLVWRWWHACAWLLSLSLRFKQKIKSGMKCMASQYRAKCLSWQQFWQATFAAASLPLSRPLRRGLFQPE